MNRREIITRQILDQIPESRWEYEAALQVWWQDPRQDRGLRLSPVGYGIFANQAKLECFKFGIDHYSFWSPRYLLLLDKKLDCPYYIGINSGPDRGSFVLFGSREAIMFNLFGNIEAWINNLELRKV